jgi:hypothetical protein
VSSLIGHLSAHATGTYSKALQTLPWLAHAQHKAKRKTKEITMGQLDTKSYYSAREIDAMFAELMALANTSTHESNQRFSMRLTEIQTAVHSIQKQIEVIYRSQAEIMQIAKAALQINKESRGKS